MSIWACRLTRSSQPLGLRMADSARFLYPTATAAAAKLPVWSLRPFSSQPVRYFSHTLPRELIPAPKPGSGPLMSRRPDRALPEINTSNWRALRTIPLFLVLMGVSSLVIFNYQKLSSSVVASTLYALRTNDEVRELLGDEVYYASPMPWIWGKIDQFHGRIDVSFRVRGTKAAGLMRFRSSRHSRMGFFETEEWSLQMDDGRVVQLLRADKPDPFSNVDLSGEGA